MIINWTTPLTTYDHLRPGLFIYAYLCPPALILPQFKPKDHVYLAQECAKMFTWPLPMLCLCCITNLPYLPFTITHLFIAILEQGAAPDMLEPLELGLWP
jgi:hypothetical protein